jgi:iron complex transport system permease protein
MPGWMWWLPGAASLGVLVAITTGLAATDAVSGTLMAALVGGLAGGAFTWFAARSSGPRALIVHGLLCSAALSAFTTLLLSAQPSRFGLLLRWLAGSVAGRVWEHLAVASIWIALALLAAWLASPLLTVLALGDAQASSLGIRPDAARLGVLMLAVVLASGAVALAGAIAFVGLAAPHAARWIAGADPRRAIPAAAAAGALAVAGSDAAAMWIGGRIAASQAGGLLAVPTGAVTAVVGAAALIAVIGSSKHVSD